MLLRTCPHVSSGELAAARHPGTGWEDAAFLTTVELSSQPELPLGCRGFPTPATQCSAHRTRWASLL